MSSINLSNIKPCISITELKCNTCQHYQFRKHMGTAIAHRCIYNSEYGMRIHGAQLVEVKDLKAPSFCPFISEEDRRIWEGTKYAEKIARKQKQLEEAEQLVKVLPDQIKEMQANLIKILEGETTIDARDNIDNSKYSTTDDSGV